MLSDIVNAFVVSLVGGECDVENSVELVVCILSVVVGSPGEAVSISTVLEDPFAVIVEVIRGTLVECLFCDILDDSSCLVVFLSLEVNPFVVEEGMSVISVVKGLSCEFVGNSSVVISSLSLVVVELADVVVYISSGNTVVGSGSRSQRGFGSVGGSWEYV